MQLLAESLPDGNNAGTTVIVLNVLIVLFLVWDRISAARARKDPLNIKQPVAVEGGGEPIRTIHETKFSDKYVHRRDHESLAEHMQRLEQMVLSNTDALRTEIKETGEKSEHRTELTHTRINTLAERIAELTGEIRRDREARTVRK